MLCVAGWQVYCCVSLSNIVKTRWKADYTAKTKRWSLSQQILACSTWCDYNIQHCTQLHLHCTLCWPHCLVAADISFLLIFFYFFAAWSQRLLGWSPKFATCLMVTQNKSQIHKCMSEIWCAIAKIFDCLLRQYFGAVSDNFTTW